MATDDQVDDVEDVDDQADEEEGAQGGASPAAPSSRPASVVEQGSGVVLGVIVYAFAINYLRGGPAQAKAWALAKLINRTSATGSGTGGGTSGNSSRTGAI
jgi:hypothetical protein